MAETAQPVIKNQASVLQKHITDADVAKNDSSLIRDLMEKIRDYLGTRSTEEEINFLEFAFEDIERYHAGQIRKSGQPAIIHPLRVAWSICQAGLDPPTVIASLLHDCIEDTVMTKKYIQNRYNDWYADVVDGLTKIKEPSDSKGKEVANREATYQKMLVAMVRDVRSLLIKLFDRLDNMRDMDAMPRHKQRRISWETLGVYVPMARRMGLEQISIEHTELCFKYLYPRRYRNTITTLEQLKQERWPAIMDMCSIVHSMLKSYDLPPTHVDPILIHPAYHIYNKRKVDRILEGFRVFVNTSMQTYHALGILHTNFNPIPSTIRDFVSSPLWNGYRAIQTEINLEGERVFVEILSQEMHEMNQHGIIAHWKGSPTELADYYRSYLEQLDPVAGDKDLRMDDVLRYTQSDQIQVFTPQGDIHAFPKGATILDFAYHIHTDLGDHCIGAMVNVSPTNALEKNWDKRVPRSRKLFHGECIQILVDKRVNPRKEWIKYAVTAKAKVQIKRAINIQKTSRARKIGKELLVQSLEKRGATPDTWIASEAFQQALKKENLTVEKFYEQIGVRKIVIRDFLNKHQLKPPKSDKITQGWSLFKWNNLFGDVDSPKIIIDDLGDALIHFAECCSPIPGDKITGITNENHEVEIHRIQCDKVKGKINTPLIKADWNLPEDTKISHNLDLTTVDMAGVLYQITKVIKDAGVAILDSKSYPVQGDDAHIRFTLEPITWKTYHRIIERLRGLKVIKKINSVL